MKFEKLFYVLNVNSKAVKPGVKLPRSNNNWSEANNYFKSIFSTLKLKQTRLMKQYSL